MLDAPAVEVCDPTSLTKLCLEGRKEEFLVRGASC